MLANNDIIIRGAKENNLKNINLQIPKNKLVVLTGLSGSGKSSIAFDTLQKECQRQYMESMGIVTDHLSKPKVDCIQGLSPSISVDQHNFNNSPRSTVGTSTEIFTYIRVLYAKLGQRTCPKCNQIVNPSYEFDIDEEISLFDEREDLNNDEGIDDSVDLGDELKQNFSCPNCQTQISELTMANFSFNKPEGACPKCTGIGFVTSLNIGALINESLSILDGAITIWNKSEVKFYNRVLKNASEYFGFKFDSSIPVKDFDASLKELLYYGVYDNRFRRHFPEIEIPSNIESGRFLGVVNIISRRLNEHINDEKYREKVDKYMFKKECPECNGTRLREESRRVLVGGKSIIDVSNMSLLKLKEWIEELPNSVSPEGLLIVTPIVDDLKERIKRLLDVGVGYLNLSRSSPSLSAGESQRLRLAALLGSGLTGVLYVLDEPTVGLHQRDTGMLINVLKQLRDLGNTVLVIEHDTEMMRSADYIIDIGPGSGKNGGQLVAVGTLEEIKSCNDSITGRCLAGIESIKRNEVRRIGNGNHLQIIDACEHNLKNISVNIPLGKLVAVTGVSGSGKSTLMFDILDKAARKIYNNDNGIPGKHKDIIGWEHINSVITIDQSPIGRIPRSNAATYTDSFTSIRNLFAGLPESKSKGLSASHFSFNVQGGRCEKCQGAGVISVNMHFLPTVEVNCPSCKGKRFKRDILDIKFNNYNISDILNMTIEEAIPIFTNVRAVYDKLLFMQEVGLGYLQLGQPATTLSGGEAQRIKLAKELGKKNKGHTLYLLDEPTTGLHPYDVMKIISILNRLVDNGNSVIVIEHNLDVISMADHIIDIGPGGGDEGGELIIADTPEIVMQANDSVTGRFLREHNSIDR